MIKMTKKLMTSDDETTMTMSMMTMKTMMMKMTMMIMSRILNERNSKKSLFGGEMGELIKHSSK